MFETLNNGLLGDYIMHLMDGQGLLFVVFAFAPIVIMFLAMCFAKNKSAIVAVGALLVAIFGTSLLLAHLILILIIFACMRRDKA